MNKLKKLLESQSRKATYVEKTPEDVYNEVAEGSEHFSPEDVSQFGGVESQHGKFDKPLAGGSARGLFQFQPVTAEYLKPGSSKSLSDMNTQSELMSKYLEKNKADNPEDAYALHNLGPNRGKKFLAADDKDLVARVIPARVIRANPGLYNVKTVGEARARIKEKLEKGRQPQSVGPSLIDKLLAKGDE